MQVCSKGHSGVELVEGNVMKTLSLGEYYKVNEPLGSIHINTLFARAVADHYVSGTIYVNDCYSPSTFYIAHPYGMSLLFGETTNEKFNEMLFDFLINSNKMRVKSEWLQVFSTEWNSKLEEILGSYLIKYSPHISDTESKVVEYTRVNFKFNINKYNELRKKFHLSPNHKVNTNNHYIYENMQGNVIPRYFWNNKDFADRAVAFSLIYQGEIVSTAFSSFLIDGYLEIGIETIEKYRGKGYAAYVCSLLIEYCIEQGFEPVWACRLDNSGSYRLAMSLGFEPLIAIPYYKLVVF